MAGTRAMLGGFMLGEAIGWTSSAFYINKNNKHPDEDIIRHMSYIGALMPVGGIPVMVILSYILDHIGRKLTMLCMAPVGVISFIVPGIIQHYVCWLIARILMGFACTGFCIAAPIYVGEIAQKEIRGKLISLFQLLLTIGILYSFILGLGRDLLLLSILTAIVPCVFFVCFLFFPETPLFLQAKGKEDLAIKSLQWYRGKNYNVTMEYLEVKATYAEMKSVTTTPKDLIATKAARRSLIIALGLMVIQQFSGINILMYYASDLFASAGTNLDPMVSSIILGAVQIGATLGATLLVDRLGRKVLLHISLTGMGFCLLALGSWYAYIGDSTPANILRALPLLIINLYMVFFSLGDGPIPWVMIGEIFPKNVKGMSGSLAGLLNQALAGFVTVTFQPMRDAIGAIPLMFVYCLLCFLGEAFVIFFVIETKGKTLEEIQEELGG